MLRHNDAIRLSAVDLKLFEALTGQGHPPPRTVADYNQRLRLAVQTWDSGPSRDERFLAAIASGLLIDEMERSSVIDQHKLQSPTH